MNKANRIMIFTSSYPYGNGEQFFEDELNLFVAHGYDITIQPYYYGHNKNPRKVPKGVKVLKPLARFRSVNGIIDNWIIINGLVRYAIKDLKCSVQNHKWQGLKWRLRQIAIAVLGVLNLQIEDENDIVYFYWGMGGSYYIPFIKEKNNRKKRNTTKIVCRFHGSDLYEEVHCGKLPLQPEIVMNSDIVVAISEFGKYYIERKYFKKVYCNRLGVINHLGKGQPSSDNVFRIVSCSSIIPLKRVDKIAEAVSCLGNTVQWIHFGDGPERSKVEEKIKKAGIENQCTLAGKLDRKEILKYYFSNPCDLFINLSETEGIPVSIMEACSFGIPAIATDVGGVSEIVVPDLLINPNAKIDQIVDKIDVFRDNWQKDRYFLREKVHDIWQSDFDSEKNFMKLERILMDNLRRN